MKNIKFEEPVREAWLGPYGMGTPAEVYSHAPVLLIRSGGSTNVEHQYNCNCCSQWGGEDLEVIPITGPDAEELAEIVNAMCAWKDRRRRMDETKIEKLLSEFFPDIERLRVFGEALINMRTEAMGAFYLIAENCD